MKIQGDSRGVVEMPLARVYIGKRATVNEKDWIERYRRGIRVLQWAMIFLNYRTRNNWKKN
jgi:hypothetical protein